MNNPQQLNVLSLDGGGVRSYSSLLILQELFATNIGLLPCNVFHITFGTSGGGLSALMVGKLRMSIQDSICQLLRVSKLVFGKGWTYAGSISKGILCAQYSAQTMIKAINDIPGTGNDMRPCTSPCKSYVVCRVALSSTPRKLEPNAVCLSSFSNGEPNCTVLEAGRATSAAPTFFDPGILERDRGRLYFDGGLGYNNPILTFYQRQRKFAFLPGIPRPAREFYLSIGTGKPTREERHKSRNSWRWTWRIWKLAPWLLHHIPTPISYRTIGYLTDVATDSENSHKVFKRIIADLKEEGKDVHYYRFNCDTGLAEVGLDEWSRLGEIEDKTGEYLQKSKTRCRMGKCRSILSI